MRKRAKSPRKPAPGRPEEFGETCLHMHCQAWLERSGLWNELLIFHVANERMGSVGAAMHFKRLGVRPGVADYLMFIRDRAVAIELKDEKGEQSDAQKKFEKHWNAVGNTYHIARTLEEFQGIVGAVAVFA